MDTRRQRKTAECEICSIEPVVCAPLKWSETPITFSREDQWHDYSNPRRYPLVLEPIMSGSRVARTLIDRGSGLNVIFSRTLRVMGLDVAKMLQPGETAFYGIVPGNTAEPLGKITLPVTFGTSENYRIEFIRFEDAEFSMSYNGPSSANQH